MRKIFDQLKKGTKIEYKLLSIIFVLALITRLWLTALHLSQTKLIL